MGAVCPVPTVDSALMDQIEGRVVAPTIDALRDEGLLYKGILYFGLMITDSGPKVLEFNVRLGDPESQVLLPLIESDFVNLIEAMLNRTLDGFPVRVSRKSALGVVVAAGGYPAAYRKGIPLDNLPEPPEGEGLIFHASTRKNRKGQVLTGGGRCFTVVGLGDDTLSATKKAYTVAESIRFDGAWYRKDIGQKFYTE
jgi:phosphoribosylamine-glycine ligase